jgi:predicted outer membrane protein
MSTYLFRTGLISALALGCLTTAHAEPPKPIDAGGAIIQPSDLGHNDILSPQSNDRRIGRWLAVDNKMLIECSKMAESKSSNAAIKQFAKMIVDEHEKTQSHLTGDGGRSYSVDPQAAAATATLIRDDGQSRAGAVVYRPTDFLAVKERVCEQMHEQAKKHFDKMSAAEFDRAFVAHMAFGHEGLIATIDAVKEGASKEFQPQLKSLRDMSEQHLVQIRDLELQLSSSTANAPASTQSK